MYTAYLQERLETLKSLIDDTGVRPIFFIGSGMSRRYINAPDWKGLLEFLIKNNPLCKYPIAYYIQNNSDNPSIASQLIEEYKEYAWSVYKEGIFPEDLYEPNYPKSIFLKYMICEYFNELMNGFNYTANEELMSLKQLKPHAIITTNYDTLLENLFEDYEVVVGQQVIKSKKATQIGQILKIHGCVTQMEEVVISLEDYEKFIIKQKYLIAKLLTYFVEHPIIFLGYSISDDNIKGILKDIAEVVCDSPERVVENIWFIEWTKEKIEESYRPLSDKSIDLGDGKSIRINYILLNDYLDIFKSLMKFDLSSIDALRVFEERVFNIVKSKSISQLEVDFLTIQRIGNEEKLAELLGIKNNDKTEPMGHGAVSLLGLGIVSEPETIKVQYCLTLTDVAKALGFTYWYPANELINKVYEETGVNIKESSNNYHVDLGIKEKQVQHRYSKDAVALLKLVRDDENYFVYDEAKTKIYPSKYHYSK
ncbi:SIR2 family protein [Lysinibacillus sp. RS5]|uniref:SIR2 family protein n=1 Tax=unclassified Lysinibacillus TaxID=2636778 RepID=UPI0035BE11B6